MAHPNRKTMWESRGSVFYQPFGLMPLVRRKTLYGPRGRKAMALFFRCIRRKNHHGLPKLTRAHAGMRSTSRKGDILLGMVADWGQSPDTGGPGRT